MSLVRIVMVIFLLGGLFIEAAWAQETTKEDYSMAPLGPGTPAPDTFSYFFQPQYNQMVRKAVVTWPKPLNFRQLRAMYMRTRQYDPLSQDTLKKMADLSFAVENTKDPEEREKKAGEFKDLVLDHLGNIDVVLQALSLSRGSNLYGDTGFYEWVVQGTEQEIMTRRKGRTMKDAYVLITMGDEALIFNRLGAKSVFSELVSNGAKFYYIHLAEDLKTRKQYEVFMDASYPMRRLKMEQNRSDKPVPLDLRQK